MTNYKKLAEEIHAASVEKGFWDEKLSVWHFMGLVFTELAEFVEAERKGKRADVKKFNQWYDDYGLDFNVCFNDCIKNTVEDELADAVIRLLDTIEGHFPKHRIVITYADLPEYYQEKNSSETIYSWIAAFTSKTDDALADRIMYMIDGIISYCIFYDIDLIYHIRLKMQYNKGREKKHGKIY